MAVLLDLGSYIPMITFMDFLEYLAPPQPNFDLGATMQSLKSGAKPALTPSNRWSMFHNVPKGSRKEDKFFSPIPEIFSELEVVATIVANSLGELKEEYRTIDFLQNPSRAPTSAAERRNESRPDGYFVLKHRDKVMLPDETEDIHWADIALSCEYKLEDGGNELDDVRIHQGL